MSLPSPRSGPSTRRSGSGSSDNGDSARRTCIERFGELLVPRGTFGKGPEASRALHCSQCCLFVLYVLLAVIFLVSVVCFLAGRVEIVDHRLKYEKLQAPSVAICPFASGSEVVLPPDDVSYTIYAVRITLKGRERLPNRPKVCQYDRKCQCLDLSNVYLNDMGTMVYGGNDTAETMSEAYRERVEIHTNLVDPSHFHTLRFGLYDATDPRPSWFYCPQFSYVIGQLRLDSWLVSDAHGENMRALVTGDVSNLDRRHFYSYTYSNTDGSMDADEDKHRYTRLVYEFRNFFVVETISAQKAWSAFTFLLLLGLLIALSNLLMIWEIMFPIYVTGEQQRRTVSRPLQWISVHLCCGRKLHHGHDDLTTIASPKTSVDYGAA